MFSDLFNGETLSSADSVPPFSQYISACQDLIKKRRLDLDFLPPKQAQLIINANSPGEFIPTTSLRQNGKYKYGALLIHGLLDCPFSLCDLGERLQKEGIFSRTILLPGHGTIPADLINISYKEWAQAVHYGVESMRSEVEQLFLIGYSTGAALSVLQAFRDENISGIILISPAIRIKAPLNLVVTWHYLMRWFTKNGDARSWIYQEEETDYTKYHSIAFNAVKQVSYLTAKIKMQRRRHPLHTPIFMVVSREDETISCHHAVTFFSYMTHARSQLLLYTSSSHRYRDKRIITRSSIFPDLNIKSFSHSSIPFSPDNQHYGQKGDYYAASHLTDKYCIFGSYNRIVTALYDVLYQLSLIKNLRRELSYNPDFNFMSNAILNFIMHDKK